MDINDVPFLAAFATNQDKQLTGFLINLGAIKLKITFTVPVPVPDNFMYEMEITDVSSPFVIRKN